MKTWIKAPFRALWRSTWPARRPVMRKLESFLRRCCAPQNHMQACRVNEETGLLMDHLIRELVRLQAQVESLQASVDELAPTSGLTVVGDLEQERTRSAG